MIRRISGTIVDSAEQFVVVDVHDVGYLIYTPNATTYRVKQNVIFYTHQAVRENILDLYGFASRDELELFELLLGLPKIGPKSALQILSQADLDLLKTAVINNDPAHLSKLSGIGKKTSEKIVLGLADIFENYVGMHTNDSTSANHHTNAYNSDAIEALISLGYPQSDARKTVQQIITSKPKLTQVNDIVKESLQLLGK